MINSILQRWRVSRRLLALCLLAVLILSAICTLSLFDLRKSMLEERQSKVRAQVESAVGIVNYFQSLAERGELSTAAAQAQAATALRGVRYEKNEYFFIINTDMVYQMHPIKPELVGQYKGDLKDSNGVMILQELVSAAKKGGDFAYFHFAKPGAKEPQPKIAYAMLVPAWNWVISTGVYEDDLNAAFINKLIITAIELFALALLLIWVSWLIARSILQQLGGEPTDAMRIMSEISAGNLQVEIQANHPNSLLARSASSHRKLPSPAAPSHRPPPSKPMPPARWLRRWSSSPSAFRIFPIIPISPRMPPAMPQT